MNPMMMGGGMPPQMGMPMQGGMGPTAPPSDPMYPSVPQFDPLAIMQMMPGMTPEMLMQMIGQGANPMQDAQMSRGGQGDPSMNPLLSALMQMGGMPPQSMPPQMAY